MKLSADVVRAKERPDELSVAARLTNTVAGSNCVLMVEGVKVKPVRVGGVVSELSEVTVRVGLMPMALNWLCVNVILFETASYRMT
jgi:hypothetical protein